MMKVCEHTMWSCFCERLSYQVQCCINCTNTCCTIQCRFLYIIYSSIPSIPVLCSFLGYATSLDKVGAQIVYKKTLQFQLAICCQIRQRKHSYNPTWRRLYVIWLLGLPRSLMVRLLLHASVFLKL